jgi:methyl-accepting chemotaxis protein
VAGEVRGLAQRSAAAAREIKALIQSSEGKVRSGVTLVHESGSALENIVTSVERVTATIEEIAVASREEAQGIDQVNRAVAQMDHVVQANAARTEELSSTADALAEQASQLQALVGRFTVGHASAPPSSPPPASAPAGVPRPSRPAMPGRSVTRRAERPGARAALVPAGPQASAPPDRRW